MSQPEQREFLLGVLWSAWFLHSAHGCDQLAQDLMFETVGRKNIQRMRRLAQAEQHHFKRGFWPDTQRRSQQ